MIHSRVKDIARPFYFRYQSRRANWGAETPLGDTEPAAFDSVLVVCIDALRPDSVPDLPLNWDHAIAAAPWTFPSVTSMLTGQYPHEHGAVAHTEPGDESFAMPQQATPDHTLPKSFADAGYETLGLFAFPIPFLATQTWFRRHRVWSDEPVETLVDYYRSWRKDHDRTFAYLHLGDLHAPVEPPSTYIERHGVDTSLPNLPHIEEYTEQFDPDDEDCRYYREQKLRLYNAALEYVEDTLEPLLAEVGEDTLVVVTGDHGEAHYEHTAVDKQFTDSRPNYSAGHGGTPLDTVARVPIGANAFVPPSETISLVDLPRTLLEYTLDRHNEPYGGENWAGTAESRPALCEGSRYGAERKAVYHDDRKIIRSKADEVTLRARIDDAGETFGAEIETADLLSALPETWRQESHAETNALVEEQLQALGYK